MNRSIAILGTLTMLLPSFGCTLIGLGIGSATSREQAQVAPSGLASVSPGSDVEVVYAIQADRPGSEQTDSFTMAHGTYRGLRRDTMVLETTRADRASRTPARELEIPLGSVQTIRIGRSSYALEGGLIGAVVDVAAVVAAVVLYNKVVEAAAK